MSKIAVGLSIVALVIAAAGTVPAAAKPSGHGPHTAKARHHGHKTMHAENAIHEPMTWDRVGAGWIKYKLKARGHWSELTSADVDQVHGDRDVFISLLSERYDLSKDEIAEDVDLWLKRLR